jgi:hypothetical protein
MRREEKFNPGISLQAALPPASAPCAPPEHTTFQRVRVQVPEQKGGPAPVLAGSSYLPWGSWSAGRRLVLHLSGCSCRVANDWCPAHSKFPGRKVKSHPGAPPWLLLDYLHHIFETFEEKLGKLASVNSRLQSNKSNFRASGMAGIEPMLSDSD